MSQNQTTSTSSGPAQQQSAANTPFRVRSMRKEATWLKMLVYGAPGVGKTTLLGSVCDVEDMQDILQIGCESGNLSLFDNDRISRPEIIDEIRITNYNQIPEIHKFLMAYCRQRELATNATDTATRKEAIGKLAKLEAMFSGRAVEEIMDRGGPRMYRTVMIDSLSEIEAYCMYGLLGVAGDIDLSKVGASMKTPEFKEYKILNNMINMFLRAMRDLPLHLLVTCGAAYEKDETQRMHYTPAITGKLSTQIQAYFDVVGFMTKARNEEGAEYYRTYLQKGPRHDAKCRFSLFKEPFIDNATMNDLVEKFGFKPPKPTFADAIDAIVS